MIAESVARDIRAELMMCETRRDIRRAFSAAQKSFERRNVPIYRRQQILKEIRANIEGWIGHEAGPKSTELIVEARLVIDALLLANS